jgi:uncharacterized caspase-like protein
MSDCGTYRGLCRRAGLLAIALAAASPGWADDRALLIGIERYKDRRIPMLPGCEADVEEIAALLRQGYGMTDRQIAVLRSADATHAAITRALEGWLVAGTRPGDRVIFYYSGHGSQTTDDGGEEEDGLDEILCPYDYEPATQAEMLRDDELAKVLHRLEGRNVTVIFDACHCGTAYKTIGEKVYADPVYPTENVIPKFVPPPNQTSGTAQQRGFSQRAGSMIDEPTENLVVFSACADQQRAEVATFFEKGRLMRRSVFTRVLLQGLAGHADRNVDGQITNAEALEYISRELSRSGRDFTQTPTMKCSELFREQPVFGRTLTLAGPARLFFYEQGKQAAVNRGEYHDVRNGDRFVVLHAGSEPEDTAEIRVMRVERFLSFGTLNKDIMFKPPGIEVRRVPWLYRFSGLQVFFGRFSDPAGRAVDIPAALRAAAAGMHHVRIVSDQSECDRIVSGTVTPDGTVQVFIYGRFGRLQSQFAAPMLQAGAELERRLRGQVFLEQLAALDNPAPSFCVSLAVKGGRERFLVYPEGDPRRETIEFVIRAEQDCHLVLLSVDSHGQVTLLLPNKWQHDTRIDAGRRYRIPEPGSEFVFSIRMPPGQDVIKAIATRKPLALRHVNAKGLNEQGCIGFDATQLDDLVQDIMTRGIGVEAIQDWGTETCVDRLTDSPTADWTTATLTIESLLP